MYTFWPRRFNKQQSNNSLKHVVEAGSLHIHIDLLQTAIVSTPELDIENDDGMMTGSGRIVCMYNNNNNNNNNNNDYGTK